MCLPVTRRTHLSKHNHIQAAPQTVGETRISDGCTPNSMRRAPGKSAPHLESARQQSQDVSGRRGLPAWPCTGFNIKLSAAPRTQNPTYQFSFFLSTVHSIWPSGARILPGMRLLGVLGTKSQPDVYRAQNFQIGSVGSANRSQVNTTQPIPRP